MPTICAPFDWRGPLMNTGAKDRGRRADYVRNSQQLLAKLLPVFDAIVVAVFHSDVRRDAQQILLQRVG